MAFIGNRYRVLNEIGSGGMGRVYRAEDRLTGQMVALKQVHVSTADLSFRSRSDYGDYRLALAQEFRTLASLRHPHIISVLDYGFHDDHPFFTMELLTDAKPFGARQAPFEATVTHIINMLQALAYLHRQGILHRDLKPENVLISTEGEVKVLDFGLALVARRDAKAVGGDTAGTLFYLAPELLKKEPPSPTSDLYAAGLVAYHALTGEHPFWAETVPETVINILNKIPDLDQLDPRLRPVIGRLLAKDPAARYPDALTTIEALSQALERPVPETPALRESYLQGAQFVGREGAITTLAEAVGQARHGEGSLWLIGGESGVGKSRLVEELRIQALVRGYDVIRGQAVAEGGRPYELWRDIGRWFALAPSLTPAEAGTLQQLVPDIAAITGQAISTPPELSAAASRQRLARTLADLMARQKRPLLIVLEDLHWAQESLDLTADIARAGTAAAIVGTYRNDEAPNLPDKLPMGEVITLGRLSREAIAELSRAMLGSTDDRLVDFLAEQTEGNVFFLVEVVRSLTQDAGSLGQVPQMSLPQTVAAEGIQRVVERRISRIPPGLLPRIRAAAVAGRRVDLALMRHLYPQGAPVDWLMQAESVLEVQENRWRFAHDKLRDGILERIPTEEVPTYHEQVAEGIETLYGAERAAALVEHWHIAGRRDKERTYAHRAAEQMLQVDDMQGAKAMAERALALAGEEHEALRGELLTIKAAVLSTEGDYEQAVTVLNDALKLLDDPVRKSNVLTDQTEAHIRQTQYAQAEEAANTALAFARDAGDYKAECDALLQLGQVNWIQSRYDEGEPYARQALAIGEEKDDKVVISNALNTLATIISRRDSPTQAIDLQERALRLKQEMGDRRGAAIMMNNLGVTARKTEQFAKSAAYYAQAVAIFQEIGFLWGVVAVSGNRGHVERQLGHYEQARQSYMTALKGSLTFNARPSMLQGLVGLADCYIQVGEPRPAATLMGLVMQHENYDDDVKIVAEPVFERLQKALPTEERIPLMEKGAALDLVDTVKQVTTGTFNAQ